jgi:hypothetical protein
MGKMTSAPFPKAERSKEPLAIIYSVICGPMSTPTKGQKLILSHSLMIILDMVTFIFSNKS